MLPAPVLDRPTAIAFVDVAVIPMDRERLLPHQTVVVQGGRIVAIGPTQRVPVPARARRVDGRGKYLIPGLADMHAHLHGPSTVSRAERLAFKEQRLFLWLAHGLTTVRYMSDPWNAGDPRDEEVLELRARQAAGAFLGPRIVTAGYFTSYTKGQPDSAMPRQVSRVDQVAATVASYKAAGFDFIKVHQVYMTADNEAMLKGKLAPADSMLFDSLVATARHAGLPLAGHTIVPLARALQTYRSIEHLSGYTSNWGYQQVLTDSLLEHLPSDSLAARIRELAVATQRAGVWNCPTLYNESRNLPLPASLSPTGGPNIIAETNLTPMRRWMAGLELVKALQDAGAGLLAGSDRLTEIRPELVKLGASNPDPKLLAARLQAAGITTRGRAMLELVYGDPGALQRELRVFVEDAGLSPYEALATATRNVAAYFGTLDSTGTVAVGKRADLVLLDGNPLADIRATERIDGVMLGGRWLNRAELDRRTATIRRALEGRCTTAAGSPDAKPSSCSFPGLDQLESETR